VKVRAVRSTGCLGYFRFNICCAMAPCDAWTMERIALSALKVVDESDSGTENGGLRPTLILM
jgi:hypothetical protein